MKENDIHNILADHRNQYQISVSSTQTVAFNHIIRSTEMFHVSRQRYTQYRNVNSRRLIADVDKYTTMLCQEFNLRSRFNLVNGVEFNSA